MAAPWAIEGVRRRRAPWRGLAGLALALGAALMVWQTVLPHLVHPPRVMPGDGNGLASQLAHLKLLGRALTLHADEHDGKFPPSIAEIEWRQTLPAMEWAGLPAAASRFHHPDTGRISEWLYYPGRTESDPPETILAASPVAVGPNHGKRLVVRLNNVAEIIAEEDFQRQVRVGGLRETLRAGRSPQSGMTPLPTPP